MEEAGPAQVQEPLPPAAETRQVDRASPADAAGPDAVRGPVVAEGSRAGPARAPAARGVLPADEAVRFQGPIYNETMRQGGRLMLVLRRGDGDRVTARFAASDGLVGSGVLTGRVSEAGLVVVTGVLMMGRNAFGCDLRGVIAGSRLTGTAEFRRAGGEWAARSVFSAMRA